MARLDFRFSNSRSSRLQVPVHSGGKVSVGSASPPAVPVENRVCRVRPSHVSDLFGPIGTITVEFAGLAPTIRRSRWVGLLYNATAMPDIKPPPPS